MRLAAIVTIIAMATTTAAAQRAHEETSGRVSYVAPRFKPKPLFEGSWIELASPTSVRHGTEFIVIDDEAGRLSRLRVDAFSGTVILLRIRVFYSDGTVQTVPLGRTLDHKHRSAMIDLTAWKAIDQIAITTEPHTQGKYIIYGASDEPGIAGR